MNEKGIACGCIILVLLFNLFLGVGCTRLACDIVFGKHPGTGTCILIGMVGGEVVIPGSLILYLLERGGVIHRPLVKP